MCEIWMCIRLRSYIAVVLQDVFLFSDTIEENIKMGQRKELQMEAVRLAAEGCQSTRVH